MAATTEISAEMPVVGVVVSLTNLNGPTHLARHNRNGVSSACNGRQVNLPVLDEVPADEVTCKRCRKMVTL